MPPTGQSGQSRCPQAGARHRTAERSVTISVQIRKPLGELHENWFIGLTLALLLLIGVVAAFWPPALWALLVVVPPAGLRHTSGLNRTHIHRRVNQHEIRRYDELFPHIHAGCLLAGNVPDTLALDVEEATVHSFAPRRQLTRIEDRTTEVRDRGRMYTGKENI